MKGMHAQGGMPIPDIHHIDQPDWWSEGGDMTPEDFGRARAKLLEDKILEIGADNVAAFIAEPVQGAGGVIVPPETYWPEVQKIVDKYGILLIADEVICGFGRTGNWFGSETVGIRPDIMTVAKGMSSGYQPIGGSIVSDEIADVIGGGEFNHGYTYSGHPVACAVALENLRLLDEEGIVDRVRDHTAPYLKQKFESLTDHPMVGEAKIVGMMGSIALTPHKESRAAFKADAGTVGLICRERCFANNLVMRHVGDRMIVSPSLTISDDEIDTLIERARTSLDEAMAEVEKQGLMEPAEA
jgi:putrescine aminotransferase